jgi:FdhD protein
MEYEKTAFFPGSRYRDGTLSGTSDCLAEEVPVALEYNGLSHAVMLATPGDLEDFAMGFSLTEGIITDLSEFYGCETEQVPDGIRVAIDIASERFHGLKDKRRNLAGRTGCGICGAESLACAVRAPQPVTGTASFTVPQLHAGFVQMEALQQLRTETGATHAAAWMDEKGKVTLLREDVGRHNALDKLIGALVRQKMPLVSGAVLVTSRASYEMVSKCAFAGISMLAAVSAPTALAVRIAEKSAMTLIGFVRQGGHTVYSHPGRLSA